MRTALALAAVLMAAPALAEEPPVATAAPDAPMSVADQIDAYLKSSPVLEVEPPGGVDGIVPRGPERDDRKVHGEVSVGVGTGGYRSVYARTDVPLGETGSLSLAFENTRYRRSHAPGRFQAMARGSASASIRSGATWRVSARRERSTSREGRTGGASAASTSLRRYFEAGDFGSGASGSATPAFSCGSMMNFWWQATQTS